VADENDLQISDDDMLMESMLGPEDFKPSKEIEEPEIDVISDEPEVERKVLASGRLGSRYPQGYERPLPPSGKKEQSKIYQDLLKQIYEGERNEGKSVDEAYEHARKLANRGYLYGSLDMDPLEDYVPPASIMAAGGRLLTSRRLVDVQTRDPNQSSFERRIEENKKQERAYRALIQKEGGEMSFLKKVWSESNEMTQEEAAAAGIEPIFKRTGEFLPEFSDEERKKQTFFGRDLEDGVGSDVGFLDDPYIPYGLKNIDDLAERAAIKIGIPNMFANLFIEEDEREAYIKAARLSLPTENFERIVETVEKAREEGLTDEKIAVELKDELAKSLTMQSYSDLPLGFQMKAPSVDLFASEVTFNPELYTQSGHAPLVQAAELVVSGADKKEIQKQLNRVALGALPNSVIAGSIPSTTRLIDEVVKAADRVIEAKGDAGKVSRAALQSFVDTSHSTEKIGDEVMVVENTLGKALRMLSIFTESIGEADVSFGTTDDEVRDLLKSVGVPETIVDKMADTSRTYGVGPIFHIAALPLFPASRDFYYNYGLRDIDSTWLSRVLANVATGNAGFTVHMTDEARKDGFERGDPEFHAKLLVGGGLDFLVPWEKLHYGPVTHSVKAAARGSSLVRKLGAKGYKTRAFLAGASPALYDRLYNVSERASLAMDNIKSRIGDKPDNASIKKLLDEDDSAQQAMGRNEPLPKNEFGDSFDPLTLNERNFAEDLFEKVEAGESFDAAFESIKRNYKPNYFETSADIADAVTRHVLETNEGQFLFGRGNVDSPDYRPGIIPWQMEQQLERAFAHAGIKYSDVKDALQKDIGGNSAGYLSAIRAMLSTGADADTMDLRNSKPYVAFRTKLEDLIKKGEMTEEQKVALLALMETRAHNSAAIKKIKSISEPEDFFNQAKIQKKTPKLDDGTLGTPKIKIKVGKLKGDIDLDSVNQFIDILKAKDILSMQRLFSGGGELLVDIMGKSWVSRFISRFDTVENTNKAPKMPKDMLSDAGKMAAEQKLRAIIEGSGRLTTETILMRELYANLTSIYSRLGDKFKQSVMSKTKTAQLDNFFRPDDFFKNSAVTLNRGRPNRPGTVVRVSSVLAERVREETARSAGTKRVFADIDVNPDHVRQSFGITKNTKDINAIDAMARGVGFVVAETMKKEESMRGLRGMPLVRLTGATFATKEQVKVIRNRVNGRMASVLGIDERSVVTGKKYLKAKRLKGMADSKSKTLNLSPIQQSSFRIFLERLSSEPFVAKRIPDELLGPNGKVDVISFKNYNRVVELLTDVEASSFARRTVYTEAISRSLAYSLLGSLRGQGANVIEATDFLDGWVKTIKEKFVLDDPLKNVRPELKEVITTWLSKLGETRAEVIQMIRKARKENPEATIEQIFDSLRNQLEEDMRITPDKIDSLVGEWDLKTGKAGRKGILHILNEYTETEVARINREFDISEDKKPRQYTEAQEEIVVGEDILQDEYAVDIPDGISRLQYLTKSSTRKLLHDLCNTGGFNGVSQRVSAALTILDTYASKTGLNKVDIENLADIDRVAIADSLMKIRDQLEDHARYTQLRGGKILQALAGNRFNLDTIGAFNNPVSKLAATGAAYKAFHRGGDGFRELYDVMVMYQAEVGSKAKKISRYSPAQAYLEMIVRLMAEDKLQGMYHDMIKHGMPGAFENYRVPKGKISPTGAKYAINTPSAFYGRVKSYMGMIFNRSLDIEEEIVFSDGSTVRRKKRDPGPDYEHASFEKRGKVRFDTDPSKFEDLDAALAAEEILVRFGVRTQAAGQELTEIVFPDGSVTYGPKAIADEIEDALNRSSSVGGAFGSKASRALSQAEFGIPYLPEAGQKSLKIRSYVKVANAIDNLLDIFPITRSNIKRGITTGLVVPIPPYFIANFLGGAFQLVTAVNPIKATSMMLKNPKMVGAVMCRMFGNGEQFSSTVGGGLGAIAGGVAAGSAFGPLGAAVGAVAGGIGGKITGKKIGKGYQPFGNHIIVAKNGMIYNANQVAELAVAHRLNSSFISAETQRSMADDIKNDLRENPTYAQKTAQQLTAWNDYLADCATAVDNFYRVSIFVDQLNDGISAGQAATLARRAAFDYGALTDFEKQNIRNIIMFYSYLKKTTELTFDTLLTNPSRVTNQLRLTGGLHTSLLEEDRQAVQRDYSQQRFIIGAKNAIANKHQYDNRMYMLPPLPVMDPIELIINIFEAFTGSYDEEGEGLKSLQQLGTKLVPWYQAPIVGMTRVDLFRGTNIDNYNNVSPWLMELDLATGGYLRDIFDVTLDTSKNPRMRAVEGDEDRQYHRAQAGFNYWFFKNMIHVPGSGRSMHIIDALDRGDLGVVEDFVRLVRAVRLEAEKEGLVDEREFEFQEGDTMSPRVGLTPMDEWLGVFAIKSLLVPNVERARSLMLQDIDRTRRKKFATSTDPYEEARKKVIYEK
jgi:hypothetical protein